MTTAKQLGGLRRQRALLAALGGFVDALFGGGAEGLVQRKLEAHLNRLIRCERDFTSKIRVFFQLD